MLIKIIPSLRCHWQSGFPGSERSVLPPATGLGESHPGVGCPAWGIGIRPNALSQGFTLCLSVNGIRQSGAQGLQPREHCQSVGALCQLSACGGKIGPSVSRQLREILPSVKAAWANLAVSSGKGGSLSGFRMTICFRQVPFRRMQKPRSCPFDLANKLKGLCNRWNFR